MEQDQDPVSEIVYYLKLLSFINPESLPPQEVERYSTYLLQLLQQQVGEVSDPIPQEIVEVDDQVLRIALLRNAKGIDYNGGSNLIYNKRSYSFNNVFEDQSYDKMVFQMVNFINARVLAEKDTYVLLHGYSGSGKSTLTRRLLESYSTASSVRRLFKLFEIYNNKCFVYYRGTRVACNDVESDRYCFCSDDILSIADRFSRKNNNGVNANSSRSHTILEMYIASSMSQYCKVVFVDLAGNEKVQTKGLELGVGMLQLLTEEAKYINSSLFNLMRLLKLGEKFKEKGCLLTKILRSAKNIIFIMLLNDNDQCLASNHLLLMNS